LGDERLAQAKRLGHPEKNLILVLVGISWMKREKIVFEFGIVWDILG
jgi:hypothetical protein